MKINTICNKKAILYILTGLLITTVTACKKPAEQLVNENTPPSLAFFEVLDKNGNSIIKKASDTSLVKITYTLNGATVPVPVKLTKLYYLPGTDTTAFAKYNGLVLHDNMAISNLNGSANAVHDFNINVNSTNLGTLHTDLWCGYLCFTATKTITLNGVVLTKDASAGLPNPVWIIQLTEQ